MSIPVLVQVYDEVRRLAIAGSAVAPGDFRLKKLVDPLAKAGEKAPVFAKVGQAVQAVVDSSDKTAAAALLELATLVNAILYTQGETGAPGDLAPLETTDLGTHDTQASARVLKPLLEALSTTGSGRIELIRDAAERGTFKDLRLVKPALGALDDAYPEVADFVADKVLPLYGKAILPELRARFDVKGRAGHLRRLELMHRLDPQGTRDLVQLALGDGSKEMKVAAVECLGTTADDLAYLQEQAKAKAKDVRAAALRALTAANAAAPDVVATLRKAIAGPDLELIVARVKHSTVPEIQAYVLEQAEAGFADLLKSKDKKLQGPMVTRLEQLIACLTERADAPAEAFLLRCFDSAPALAAIKSEPSGADVNELVAHVLSQGTPAMQNRLVAAHESLTGEALSAALYAARAAMTPAEFYAAFRPLLAGHADKRTKANAAAHDRATALVGVLGSEREHYLYRHWMGFSRYHDRPEAAPLKELDPRWLDAAVDARLVDLACALARPGHAGVNRLLLDHLATLKKPHESHSILLTMVRINHPGAADALIDVLKKHAKETTYYYSYWHGRMIPDLPRGALPKFEALLPTLPEKMVDQLMDAVTALRNKPE